MADSKSQNEIWSMQDASYLSCRRNLEDASTMSMIPQGCKCRCFFHSDLRSWTCQLWDWKDLHAWQDWEVWYRIAKGALLRIRGSIFPISGHDFAVQGLTFCTPSQFLQDPMDTRVSREGTSGARVGFPLIFDQFQGPLWDMFLSTWLIFQRLEATEFQHLSLGGFSWHFSLEVVLKFDGEMCWNHHKYNGFR